jgi:Ca-activated chloride channel family protein
VVLLTDGASNAGPEPLDAAAQAADRGVRVYTIGFGTAQGGAFAPECAVQFLGREPGGGGFGGFGGGQNPNGFRRGIDEGTLQSIADRTGGTYYSAESAGELQSVFASLPTNLIAKHVVLELSAILVAAAAAAAAVAYLLGRAWRPLP